MASAPEPPDGAVHHARHVADVFLAPQGVHLRSRDSRIKLALLDISDSNILVVGRMAFEPRIGLGLLLHRAAGLCDAQPERCVSVRIYLELSPNDRSQHFLAFRRVVPKYRRCCYKCTFGLILPIFARAACPGTARFSPNLALVLQRCVWLENEATKLRMSVLLQM